MEERGFIRDMLDVKVLILFVAAKAKYPLTLQKIYELCYQDDRLSYFDVSIAVPQMVESGHLEKLPDGTYVVTQKGAEQEEVTRDSIALPVMQRALAAVAARRVCQKRACGAGKRHLHGADAPGRRHRQSHEAGADRTEQDAGQKPAARV